MVTSNRRAARRRITAGVPRGVLAERKQRRHPRQAVERTAMATTRPPDTTSSALRKREQELPFGHSATSVLLPPDPAHVEAIRKSHERCAALGLSRISADYTPRSRADLTIARERNH